MSRTTPLEKPITIELDGQQLSAKEGEPLAVSVIAAGELLFARSPKYHRPRGPYCLSGGCSSCLMRVDGVPNVATCRVPARAGMRLERQNALPDANVDLLRAADFVFQKWFNHHEFLAGVPIAETVLQKVARQLSGLGVLPEHPAPQRAPASIERLGTVIIGAGAAGLATAKRLSELAHPYTLLERDPVVGGRLSTAAEAHQPALWQPPPAQTRTGAVVVGLFADDGPPFLAVLQAKHLSMIFFERLVLTVGGQPEFPTFPNNDLPGVMAGRAVSALLRRHDVLPGHRVACCGEASEARALASLVTAHGGEALVVGSELVQAHGLSRVNAVTVRQQGQQTKHDCDVIAVCGPVNPSFELARAAGATVSWHPTHRVFLVEADDHGQTGAPGVFVAGEIRGPMSSATAAEQGLVVAEHLARPGAAS
jgi:sarcosine oxidase subunit alpha